MTTPITFHIPLTFGLVLWTLWMLVCGTVWILAIKDDHGSLYGDAKPVALAFTFVGSTIIGGIHFLHRILP